MSQDRKRVLVVDDATDIRNLIKDILTAQNYEVYAVENGALALDNYAKFNPDIVTLDLAMPVLDGYETLSRMLKLDTSARIIMITASEHEQILGRCLQAGAVGYLVKPFSEEELLNIITNASSLEYDKTLNAFFSLVRNKIENAIKKIVSPETSIILKDVSATREERSSQVLYPTTDLSQVKSVPGPIEQLEIEAPDGAKGYISEIGGHLHGMIVSFIRDEDLAIMMDHQGVKGKESHESLEFFNVINTKVLSELANSTRMILSLGSTRLYDRTKDKGAPAAEVAKAKFEIILGEKTVPIEIQLWFNISKVFGSGF